jgi:hypothetical protein
MQEIHRYVKTCMHPVCNTIVQLPSDCKVWWVGEESEIRAYGKFQNWDESPWTVDNMKFCKQLGRLIMEMLSMLWMLCDTLYQSIVLSGIKGLGVDIYSLSFKNQPYCGTRKVWNWCRRLSALIIISKIAEVICAYSCHTILSDP